MNTQVRLYLNHKVIFAEGHAFGESGPYERLIGVVSFALDPVDPDNENIVDLEYAPRNTDGLVELKALQGQQSHRIKSFAKANCWGIFPSGKSQFKSGNIILSLIHI